jgi:hypothetical protein
MYKYDDGHFFIRVDYRFPTAGNITRLPVN